METSALRQFGLELVGEVPWGTHLCQFYESEEDLIEILVPYFAEGLRGNEFCMWVTSLPLEVEEAKKALQKAVPNLSQYIKKGQVEILPYTDWYLPCGKFDADRVLQRWVEKEKDALNRGLEGLRLTGNTFWVERNDWTSFTNYETAINSVITEHRMIALCTYSLERCTARDMVDVIKNHVGTLIRREGKWCLVEDSSERKKMEEEVRSAARFPSENPYPVFRIEKDGTVVYSNSAGLALLNERKCGVGQLAPKPWRQLVLDALGSGEPRQVDETYRGKTFSNAFVPIIDSGYVNVYGRDITKRRKMEEQVNQYTKHLEKLVEERNTELIKSNKALQKEVTEHSHAEEKLRSSSMYVRSLIEASLDPLVTISVEGKITDVNEATEIVTGVPRDRLIGRDFSDYFTEPDKARVGYQRVFSEGFVKDYPLAIRHTSGKITNVLYNATVYKNEARETQGVFAAARDITERKLAEEKIREQAELLDKAHDGITVRDLENYIIYWNKGAERMYGWKAEEVIGKKADQILYKGDPILPAKALTNAIGRGEWSGELYHVTKDGKEIIVDSHWTLMRDNKGNPKSIMAINTDITEEKNLEAKILSSQRMAAIGETAGMVGHDIRNPLQAIEAAIYLGKDALNDLSLPNQEKESIKEMFEAVEEQTRYINKIVSDLQDYARPLKPELMETSLLQLIEDSLSNFNMPRDIEVSTIVTNDLPNLKVDPGMMKRVLVNLIANSMQAMPNGGKLTIKALRKRESACISIQDSGIGIPEDVKPNIFQPMFTTKSKGQGLGLAVCKRILEAHNGEISFESELGKGTIFTLRLPIS